MISKLKKTIFDGIMRSPLYPHIFFYPSPFKIYEFRHLMKKVALQSTDTVLDIGCGPGLQTTVIGKACGKVIGIDISENAIARATSDYEPLRGRVNCEFRCTKMEDAAFEDKVFDHIFSICVIEHIPNYEVVLRECFRTLKSRGSLIFSADSLATISDNEIKSMHTTRYHVVRYFSSAELKKLLEDVGFVDVSVEPLFRSRYAAEKFVDGVRRDFTYHYSESVRMYYMLRIREAFSSQREEGVFLSVTCRKP